MIAAAATHGPVLDSYRTEWRILREYAYNVLLEGPVAATDAALLRLLPHVRDPIVWNRPHAPLSPLNGKTRTFILSDADALSADNQQRLLAWLDGTGSRTQVISMTQRPLYTLVRVGLFDATLYYRLNVMLLQVGFTEARRTGG
jgi:hypothetical protein